MHRWPAGTAVPGVERAPNPSRFLRVRNMETPTGSSVDNLVLVDAGKPTVREAELLGGNRMPKKRTPVAERQQETADVVAASFRRLSADNWPDTGPGARLRKQC